jgi:cell division FtsZ-interacting protein ZapD
VAFLQRWCQADEEELRAVEQEIRAKEEELVARKRVCQQIRERLAASQSSLDMLSKQHQPLLTFSAPDDGQLARDV